ncbi:uncharacterized protein LOC120356692 [Nilaparvata lugens]|uniref:uncharacterized protein LOC120350594 n=1 Tax=Nilaparvata lugens TaxID=108931 RepID=UPI00193EAE73|nr:uncharacterized protein LOC120350594 [Nilaparvata lugens]XP_039284347.1 uncharacterized protein LOC120351380 [Nilaparvata lugens]XP_039301590.1 uncharacterized protein LOC120356692 [Nilaparvata lugens]
MDKQQSDKAAAATSEEAVTPTNNTLVESIAHDKEVEVEMASEEWCVVDSSESPPAKRVHFSTACDTPKRGGRGHGIYFADQRRVIAQGRGRQIDVAGVSADSSLQQSSRNSGQQAEASSSSLILLDVTNSSQPRIVNATATNIDNEVENIDPQETSSSKR